MRGLEAWPLEDARTAVARQRCERDIEVLAQFSEVAEAGGQRRGKVGERAEKALAVVDSACAGKVLVEPSRILQPTDAQGLLVVQGDRQHDAFDQDLGQQHVHLGDDIGDHFHVLLVRKDDQRIGAFIGNNPCIGQQLDLGSAGGAVDDLLQPLLERGAAGCGPGLRADGLQRLIGLLSEPGPGAITAISAEAAAAAAVSAAPVSAARAGCGGNLSRTALLSRSRARSGHRIASGTSSSARSGNQRVHRVEQIRDLPIFNGNDLELVIGLGRHIHLFDQLEHPFDVRRVIADYKNLVGINGDNSGGILGEGREELG